MCSFYVDIQIFVTYCFVCRFRNEKVYLVGSKLKVSLVLYVLSKYLDLQIFKFKVFLMGSKLMNVHLTIVNLYRIKYNPILPASQYKVCILTPRHPAMLHLSKLHDLHNIIAIY